ncbi:efflux transporter outer membrane subunit [Orrella marina]|uniref:RND transporter n=1 Tax=Orrella marina TaxID=2163011 RepID=A0A2R4XN52_9BURK|nr:efflux transporter outer membrane subunit [Orrella marina]AWB35139.1 RND transporter [Orrella marina]
MLLAGCQVGPEYRRPDVDVGQSFRAAEAPTGWLAADQVRVELPDQWWTLYRDFELDRLMTSLQENSPTIQQALARYRQAIAMMKAANASLYPTLTASAQVTRADVPTAAPSGAVLGGFGPNTEYNTGVGVSWEVDLWGALASDAERAQSQVQASSADLAAARLSAQAALASSYFQLRGLDQHIMLFHSTVRTYERSLTLTRNLVKAGLSDPSDVPVARAQLEAARSQMIDTQRRRAVLQNAIAVLLGVAPAQLQIDPNAVWKADIVSTPAGVPSELLLRRPDIAAAERRVAAANAQVGVATAAWFPSLTISANGGYQSTQFSKWFSAPAQFWALGPALAATLFDAGRRTARIEQAQAEFDLQAASYRETVLRALQEVEDAMVQLALLQEQSQAQQRAVNASRESVRMKRDQYEKGIADFLSVAVLETTALNAERTAISLQTDQLAASVQLVAALGGAWSVNDLPNPGDAVRTP